MLFFPQDISSRLFTFPEFLNGALDPTRVLQSRASQTLGGERPGAPG